jgi:hypothetical protein
MNRADDRHNQSFGLWWLRVKNQFARIGFSAKIVLGGALIGAFIVPTQTLDRDELQRASSYGIANTMSWIAGEARVRPKLRVRHFDRDFIVPVDVVMSDGAFIDSADLFQRRLLFGGWLGLLLGCGLGYFLNGNIRRSGNEAFTDRVIGGTRVVSENALGALTRPLAGQLALQIGRLAVPAAIETRHCAMIGTTGSGKTTVLRQQLDCIEARGEAAIVYDTSGEFIAHYYRPERGDIILNPFDARTAYWTPFDEIAHPADADRIAHQLVTETRSKEDDVWLITSRLLVANMLRALWSEGKCSLEALLDALQTKDVEELKRWLGDTSSARTFAEGAERATGSVIFMLAKAAGTVRIFVGEGLL